MNGEENNTYMICIIIIYIILCKYTKYPTNNNNLTNNEKNLLLVTNIYGYLLGILILIYETKYLYINYNNNMIVRLSEFIIILSLLCLGIYANIFQEDANSGLGKISSALIPLLTSFAIILILCLNTIIIYNIDDENIKYKKFDEFSGLII